jgi:gliding motility-associated-like protein
MNIFNRWGELIFESTDVNIGWDGYYRGKLCKQDVYVWKVTGKFSNGDLFTLAGDVTLLK